MYCVGEGQGGCKMNGRVRVGGVTSHECHTGVGEGQGRAGESFCDLRFGN